MLIIKQQIAIYTTQDGRKPFIEWLESLIGKTRYRVKTRLDRVLLGNFGDHKYLDEGVYELRLQLGSGYRIYYGVEGKIVILLCGGDKATQQNDIKKAYLFWQDYLYKLFI